MASAGPEAVLHVPATTQAPCRAQYATAPLDSVSACPTATDGTAAAADQVTLDRFKCIAATNFAEAAVQQRGDVAVFLPFLSYLPTNPTVGSVRLGVSPAQLSLLGLFVHRS